MGFQGPFRGRGCPEWGLEYSWALQSSPGGSGGGGDGGGELRERVALSHTPLSLMCVLSYQLPQPLPLLKSECQHLRPAVSMELEKAGPGCRAAGGFPRHREGAQYHDPHSPALLSTPAPADPWCLTPHVLCPLGTHQLCQNPGLGGTAQPSWAVSGGLWPCIRPTFRSPGLCRQTPRMQS